MCSKSGSPAPPHFWAQAPSGAQQLRVPDDLIVPHLGHASAAAAVSAGGDMFGGANEG